MTAYIFKKWYLLNTLDLMKGKVKALLDTEYFFYLQRLFCQVVSLGRS